MKKVELLCNCEAGKVGEVVNVSDDTFKAYGKDYMEVTKKELTKKEDVDLTAKSKDDWKKAWEDRVKELEAQAEAEKKNKEAKSEVEVKVSTKK